MSEESGCGLVVGCLIVIAIVGLTAFSEGHDRAYDTYRECLRYRATAPSDTVVITMQPKCAKWLRPETNS